MDNPILLWVFGGIALLSFGWSPIKALIKKSGIKFGGDLDLGGFFEDGGGPTPSKEQLKPTTSHGKITEMFAVHFSDGTTRWLTVSEMKDLQEDACEALQQEEDPSTLTGEK